MERVPLNPQPFLDLLIIYFWKTYAHFPLDQTELLYQSSLKNWGTSSPERDLSFVASSLLPDDVSVYKQYK